MRGSTLKFEADYRGVRFIEKISLLLCFLVPAPWVVKFKAKSSSTENSRSKKKRYIFDPVSPMTPNFEQNSIEIIQIRMLVELFHRDGNLKH